MYLSRYNLKFCPNCVRDDIEKCGESYWKLSHQLPTNYFCLKHEVILEEWDNSQTDLFLKTVKISDLSVIKTKEVSNKTLFYAKKIAKQSLDLNKENLNLNLNYKFNFGKFYLLLFVNGYVKQSGKVNIIKLEEDMTTFYGKEFLGLEKFNQRIYEQIENNPLICHIHFTFIETLLFINFFFKSYLDFIKYNYILPSGETGPFPCVNYFCIHFNQNIIKDIRIYMDNMKKFLQIEFKCNQCNCRYETVFRIWDGYLIETIVDKSEEWKMKVANLVYNKGWSIENASNKLHISSIEIEKILYENKFKTWMDPVVQITETNNTIDWVKRDIQVLLYLKAIVRIAIIKNKPRRVYSWILRAVDNINIKAGLPNLQKTREYIEMHERFNERLYKRESFRV